MPVIVRGYTPETGCQVGAFARRFAIRVGFCLNLDTLLNVCGAAVRRRAQSFCSRSCPVSPSISASVTIGELHTSTYPYKPTIIVATMESPGKQR
jgi:hypothetical protein